MTRIRERVSTEEAIKRAQTLAGRKYVKASQFGYAIWPRNQFLNSQGAALAAGRILGIMKKRGLARWGSVDDDGFKDWGWEVFLQ